MALNKTPVVGEFTSSGGLQVKVRAATIGQMVRIDAANLAEDKAESLRAGAALVSAVCEVEGFEDAADALAVADFEKVFRLACGGGDADFR